MKKVLALVAAVALFGMVACNESGDADAQDKIEASGDEKMKEDPAVDNAVDKIESSMAEEMVDSTAADTAAGDSTMAPKEGGE